MTEAMTVWVPLKPVNKNVEVRETDVPALWRREVYIPAKSNKTKVAEDEIKELVTQGWKIVANVPMVGALMAVGTFQASHTYTCGYQVWLER